jgi:CheY-like chemotaxis protein
MNSEPHARNLRILVIDDNRAIHEDFRKVLGSSRDASELDDAEAGLFGPAERRQAVVSFEIESAFQGQEGLAMVKRAK